MILFNIHKKIEFSCLDLAVSYGDASDIFCDLEMLLIHSV